MDVMTTEFQQAQQRIARRRRTQSQTLMYRQGHDRQPLRTNSDDGALHRNRRWPFPLRNLGEADCLTWSAIRGREGTRPAHRVGQVDAELLDENLLELLKDQAGEGFKLFNVDRSTFLLG